MTAERRLAKLEGALSPKAATLLWLEEAQQFRSLPAYVAWLIDQPISASPLAVSYTHLTLPTKRIV